MTNLKQILKYKKFSFEIDQEDQISIKFFKHSFILFEYEKDLWYLSIDWDSTSKVSKQETKKTFIQFIKLLRVYKIKYTLDENLDFNNK